MFHDAVLGTLGRECKQSTGRELVVGIPRVSVQVRAKSIFKRGPGFTTFGLGGGSDASRDLQRARRFYTRTINLVASRWTGSYTPSGEPEPTHTWDTAGFSSDSYSETMDASTRLPTVQDIDITSLAQSGNATGTLGDLTNSVSRTGADYWGMPAQVGSPSYATIAEGGTLTTRTVSVNGNNYDQVDINGNRVVSDYTVSITETVTSEFDYAAMFDTLNTRLGEIAWQDFAATTFDKRTTYDQWDWYRYWSGDALQTQEVDLSLSPPGAHDGSESTAFPYGTGRAAFTPDGTTDIIHYPGIYDGSDGGVAAGHLQFRTVNGSAEYGIIERLWFPSLNKYVAKVVQDYGVTSPNVPVTAPDSTFLSFGVMTVLVGNFNHAVTAFAPEIIVCFGRTATAWLAANSANHLTDWTDESWMSGNENMSGDEKPMSGQ